MNRPLATAFIATLLSIDTSAQKLTNVKEFINHLLSDSGVVTDIYVPSQMPRPIEIDDIRFGVGRPGPMQKFIRTTQGLFALVDGTGRVYQVKLDDSELTVERIDSTIFSGYNFGAFSFSYRDTLFSYGGYGFWNYNGQLRVYIPHKQEWELIQLTKEVPIQVSNPNKIQAWFDSKFGQLYINRMPEKALIHDSLYVLDLQKGIWKTLGMNVMPFEDFSMQIQTPWGILCRASNNKQDNIYLLDFRSNQIRFLAADKSQNIKMLEDWKSLSFFSDSSLFIHGDRLYQVLLSNADFTSTGKAIYEEVPNETVLSSIFKIFSWPVFAGIGLGLFIGLAISFFLKKTRTINRPQNAISPALNGTAMFDEKEMSLIRLIFENSSKSISTSIEDINRILGLSDKPSDLQKKHRSDIITSINKKFRYITHGEGLLLKRYRSEVDKRSFEFYIDYEDYKLLNGHF